MPMKAIEIDLVPEFVRPSFRTKRICLTMDDWGRIGDDLVRQFPMIRFIRSLSDTEWLGEALPDLRIETDLRSVLPPKSYEFSVFFEPDLRLNLRRERHKPYAGYTGNWIVWRFNTWGLPRLHISPSFSKHGWDGKGPERIGRAQIDFAGEHGNKKHQALAQQIFGIIRRQVKKEPLLFVEYPTYRSRPSQRDTRLEWISHDAMRWARADSKRLLAPDMNPDGTGWGYRPAD